MSILGLSFATHLDAAEGFCNRIIRKWSALVGGFKKSDSRPMSKIVVPSQSSDLSLIRLLSEPDLHPLVREIFKISKERDLPRLLRPAVFRFLSDFDYFLKMHRTSYALNDQGISDAVYDFATEALRDSSPEILEELAKFKELSRSSVVALPHLWKWLAFGILSSRLSLLESNPKEFLKHLQEISALEFIMSLYQATGYRQFYLALESPVFADEKLPTSLDIGVSHTEAKAFRVYPGRKKLLPYSFFEVKQPQNFRKAEDLNAVISSTLEALDERLHPKDLRFLTMINIVPGGFSELTELRVGELIGPSVVVIQVDWSFDKEDTWQARSQTVHRDAGGDIQVQGRSIGNIYESVRKFLESKPKAKEYLGEIYLVTNDGIPLVTFVNTKGLRSDSAFLEKMADVAPDFHNEVTTQDWLYVSGAVLRIFKQDRGELLMLSSNQVGEE